MDNVTQYEIVRATKAEDLVPLVNEKLKGGWKLLGGVQVQMQPAPGGGGYLSFLQTMVK